MKDSNRLEMNKFNWSLAAIFAVGVLLVLVFSTNLLSWRGYHRMGPGMMRDFVPMGWLLIHMILIPIGLLVAAMLGGFWLMQTRDQSRRPRWERALEILKERYAKGEITREEFAQMQEDLTRDRSHIDEED